MVLLLPPHVPAVPPASLSFVYHHLPVLVIGRTFIINQLERLLRCLSLLRSDLLFFWTLINLSLLKKDTWNWSHRPARSKKSKVYFLDVFACFEQELRYNQNNWAFQRKQQQCLHSWAFSPPMEHQKRFSDDDLFSRMQSFVWAMQKTTRCCFSCSILPPRCIHSERPDQRWSLHLFLLRINNHLLIAWTPHTHTAPCRDLCSRSDHTPVSLPSGWVQGDSSSHTDWIEGAKCV